VLKHVGSHLIISASGVFLDRVMFRVGVVVLVDVIPVVGLVRLDVVDLFLRLLTVTAAH
jgi:hypothetical protein